MKLNRYTAHLLKRSKKDALPASRHNQKVLKRLCNAGYLRDLGRFPTEKYKGKTGYLLTKPGEAALNAYQVERKSDRHFWITTALALAMLLVALAELRIHFF